LVALIDDILDISKIEARRITLENVIFDVHHIIEGVVQLSRVQANAKGLRVRSRISAQIPRLLHGDPHRLRQVLTNLLFNATKFTEQGEVTLDAELANKSDGSATIRFSISDTGIGIRSDQIARLFSPFTQADTSTTRKYGGAGLGLAICKHLVEMMGGTIGVNSQEGQGSTFWFTAVFVLASPEQRPANEVEDGMPGIRSGATFRGQRARILVAEDNATNREVALAQLRRLGHKPTAVTNGADAVSAVALGHYDLVLMDCEMPVMDGFEATRLIRSSAGEKVPIVALTANASSTDRDRCLREGMNDFLAKPTELGRLAEVLSKWLSPAPIGNTDESVGHPADHPGIATFDAANLLLRLADDRQLARKVLTTFLEDAPSQLQTLRKWLDAADANGVRVQAHTLKGASATVAAEGLRAIAQKIEAAGAAGTLGHCNDLLARAGEEFERFKMLVDRLHWA
jgi:CheY-like chemotaxis protein/HPt (histidine-containing phosphotransfer) domain-containing protein